MSHEVVSLRELLVGDKERCSFKKIASLITSLPEHGTLQQWITVAVNLRITIDDPIRLEEMYGNQKTLFGLIHDILILWRQAVRTKATVSRLCRALKKSDLPQVAAMLRNESNWTPKAVTDNRSST